MKDTIYIKLSHTINIIEEIQRKIIQKYNSTEKDQINSSARIMINQMKQLEQSKKGYIKLDDLNKIIDENNFHQRLITELFNQDIYNKIYDNNDSTKTNEGKWFWMEQLAQVKIYKLIKQNIEDKHNGNKPFNPNDLELRMIFNDQVAYKIFSDNKSMESMANFLYTKGYLTDELACEEIKETIKQIVDSDKLTLKYSGKQVRQLFELMQKLQKSLDVVNRYNVPTSVRNSCFYKRTMIRKAELPLKPLTYNQVLKLFKPKSEKLV